MPSLLAYLAPMALLLPAATSGDVISRADHDPARLDPREVDAMAQPGPIVRHNAIAEWTLPEDIAHQVRIERRVTVRISPRGRTERQSLMAEAPQAQRPVRYEERKMEKCLSVDNIAAVQTGSGDRLVLFLRDRRMVSARLEKSCRARDFYSGFYLERNEDGKLCVDRDKLQSRVGAKCELDRIREMVAVFE